MLLPPPVPSWFLSQEHLHHLPPFVRLLLTCRPHPRVRAVLAAPSLRALAAPPAALCPPPPACVTALAARLAARAELRLAFRSGRPSLQVAGSKGGGCRDGNTGGVEYQGAGGGGAADGAGGGAAGGAWPQVGPSPEPWSLELAEALWKVRQGGI